jgi:hypothetical protein
LVDIKRLSNCGTLTRQPPALRSHSALISMLKAYQSKKDNVRLIKIV